MSRGRPPAEVSRPKHVAIRENIVACRHVNCHHIAGPFPSRDATALAAQQHWARTHAKGGPNAQ